MSAVVKTLGEKNNGLYIWKKTSVDNGDFVNYVVSDNPTKYPDGDISNGYRYEKIKQILDPKYFGCSEMVIDTYTPKSNNYLGNVVSHSLGQIPKVIIIFTEDLENAVDSNLLHFLFSIVDNKGRAHGILSSINKNAQVINYFYNNETDYQKCTSSNIVFYSSGTHTYKGGQKYTIITMC